MYAFRIILAVNDIISPNSTNWLIFVAERHCVSFLWIRNWILIQYFDNIREGIKSQNQSVEESTQQKHASVCRTTEELTRTWNAGPLLIKPWWRLLWTTGEPPTGETQVIRTHHTGTVTPEHTFSAPRIHSHHAWNGHNFFTHPPLLATSSAALI